MTELDKQGVLKKLRLTTGLVKDKKAGEFFNLMSLFRFTLKSKNLSETDILKKVRLFADFIGKQNNNTFPSHLTRALETSSQSIWAELNDGQVLFNKVLLHLFSLAFKVKFQVFQISNNFISQQKIGLSSFETKVKLFVTAKEIVVLKKRVLKLKKGRNVFVINGTVSKQKLNSNIEDLMKVKTSDTLKTTNTINRLSKPVSTTNCLDQLNSLPVNFNKPKKPLNRKKTVSTKFQKNIKFVGNSSKGEEGRFKGRLKFFIDKKDYGFVKMEDGIEIFVHKLDLVESNIDFEKFIRYKDTSDMLLEFSLSNYKAKNKVFKKATRIKILEARNLL